MPSFAVKMQRPGHPEKTLASGLTYIEAAEVAYRLTRLQDEELGGLDEFVAMPEES